MLHPIEDQLTKGNFYYVVISFGLVSRNAKTSDNIRGGVESRTFYSRLEMLNTHINILELNRYLTNNSPVFYSTCTKINTDKISSKKEIEANQQITGQISTVGDNAMGKQGVTSGAASTDSLHPPTTMMLQPKIDATDRRQIEAQNEDKSHTTKEALDDIKRTHYKQKKKKNQDNIEPCQSGINIQELVRITLIL